MARTTIDYTKVARERLQGELFFRKDIVLLETIFLDSTNTHIKIGDIIQGANTSTFLVKLDRNDRPIVQKVETQKEILTKIEDEVYSLREFLNANEGVKILFNILIYNGTV